MYLNHERRFYVELLEIWKAADPGINVTLAMALSALVFAAATFLTHWVETKSKIFVETAGDQNRRELAERQLICAKQGVKDLLKAFVAFSFLLADSIFVDPLAVIGAQWSGAAIFDAISSSGSLGVGMFFFLKAAWNIHDSVG
jgi:hypothetical protein